MLENVKNKVNENGPGKRENERKAARKRETFLSIALSIDDY